MQESITFRSESYIVVGRDELARFPEMRKRMTASGIKCMIYIRRPRGRKVYQGLEYENGLIGSVQ